MMHFNPSDLLYKRPLWSVVIIIIIIISVMELGHILTHSGLTYPEISSKVHHDSFCQLGISVSLPWVTNFEAFYLHAVSSFSFIPVIFPKLVLFFNSFAMLWSVRRINDRPKCVIVVQSEQKGRGYSLNKLNLLIFEEWKTNLMSLAILFHFLRAQHVSDINIIHHQELATVLLNYHIGRLVL